MTKAKKKCSFFLVFSADYKINILSLIKKDYRYFFCISEWIKQTRNETLNPFLHRTQLLNACRLANYHHTWATSHPNIPVLIFFYSFMYYNSLKFYKPTQHVYVWIFGGNYLHSKLYQKQLNRMHFLIKIIESWIGLNSNFSKNDHNHVCEGVETMSRLVFSVKWDTERWERRDHNSSLAVMIFFFCSSLSLLVSFQYSPLVLKFVNPSSWGTTCLYYLGRKGFVFSSFLGSG